ncbi:MAG: BatD family protein [Clostridium sp.]|nr:BatD family protein [Clostridium sp.]
MSKRILLMLFVLVSWGSVRADIKVTASAPNTVVLGEDFHLKITINTHDATDFHAPDMSDFDVLMGPSRSTSSSIQIINGRTTQNSSLTMTYILSAKKEGTFSIKPAAFTVGGTKHSSNALTIKVLPPDTNSGRQQGGRQQGGSGQAPRTQSAGENISGKDLFIAVTANKKKLYEQEAVVVTYKVYSKVNLASLVESPNDMEGFHVQEVPLPNEKTLTMEHYNGSNYQTAVWRQYVLFPQRTGKLTIPAIKYEAIVRQQNRLIDPFDAFFMGAQSMVEVKKTIVAPAITLQVDPLPDRPANFSGAVGDFTIEGSLTPEELKTNEAVTMKVTVSGTGNMKLIKSPIVAYPKDFEVYDPKITDDIKTGKNGVGGKKTFEYLAVPRHAGQYEIPAVDFCYFSPSSGSYKTISTSSYTINVEKGSGTVSAQNDYTAKEDLKMLGSDIRYIKSGEVTYRQRQGFFFSTLFYWLSYAGALVIFFLLLFIFRRRARENSNVARLRGKKANKVAAKRLKKAKGLLHGNNKDQFYDETTRALWGYVGDKLSLPVAELNKDNVQDKLRQRGVDDLVISDFLTALDDCEFARYAPGDAGDKMEKLYTAVSDVINRMENVIK